MKKLKLLFGISNLVLVAATLTGCGLAKSLEQDATIVLLDNNIIVNSYRVNIFNNAIIDGISADDEPEGKDFLGWSKNSQWTPEIDSKEEIFQAGALIRYEEILNQLDGNLLTLHAVYIDEAPPVEKFLVVGWYAKTATSGLDETIITNLTTSLSSYLGTQNVGVKDIANTELRPYDGSVADIGTAINNDGDVDIVIGVGNNIDSTGGVVCQEKQPVKMGGKSRYIARLTDKPIAISVFAWLQSAEAGDSLN